MFIKRGDDIKNKIVAVIDEEELSEEHKKASKDIAKKVTTETESSNKKDSGR